MKYLLFFLAFAAIFVIARMIWQAITQPAGEFPYQRRPGLFTPAERSFLGALRVAVGDSAVVFGKVRVADVLKVRPGIARSEWQSAFNRISAKHFDFVICDPDDLSFICAVKLDDSSHGESNRRDRDAFLARACEAAKLPLVRVSAKQGYSIAELREFIAPHLGSIPEAHEFPAFPDDAEFIESKICPMCGSVMVKRTAKRGPNAGTEYWACSSFPDCRHTEDIGADERS